MAKKQILWQVDCKGCDFRSHAEKREDAEAIAESHKAARAACADAKFAYSRVEALTGKPVKGKS